MSSGKVQGRRTANRCYANVGRPAQQDPGHLQMAPISGIHERGPACGVALVDVDRSLREYGRRALGGPKVGGRVQFVVWAPRPELSGRNPAQHCSSEG